MGRRGPAKKPTAQKILEGNPGKRALNTEEPEYESDESMLVCPPSIKGEGKKEWERVAPGLIGAGVLRKPDYTIFFKYCRVVMESARAERLLDGLYNGQSTIFTVKQISSAQNDCIKLRAQYVQHARELGLTPASRAGIKAIKPDVKNDDRKTTPGNATQPDRSAGILAFTQKSPRLA